MSEEKPSEATTSTLPPDSKADSQNDPQKDSAQNTPTAKTVSPDSAANSPAGAAPSEETDAGTDVQTVPPTPTPTAAAQVSAKPAEGSDEKAADGKPKEKRRGSVAKEILSKKRDGPLPVPQDMEIFELEPSAVPEGEAPEEPVVVKRRREGPMGLAEELGIEDLTMPVLVGKGRMLSAAGPDSPIVEFTDEYVVMHPPQLPFAEEGQTEDIVIRVDKRGVLLDELGQPKGIAGAKFRGHTLWFAGEQKEGTLKHFGLYFDQHGITHKLYVNNDPLTTDIIFRLRNKTHDGELAIFPDIKSD